MKIAIIQNNFVSLLTFVHDYYYKFNKEIQNVQFDTERNFIDNYHDVKDNLLKAKQVRKALIEKIGNYNYLNITKAFLSNNKNKAQIIFEYILLVFKYGKKVLEMYDNKIVMDFNYMLKKVLHETHRMTGFIRFKQMQNEIYYSYFSGDNDILELIIPHFKNRFNDQQFILHDIKRNKLGYYDGNSAIIIPAPDKIEIILHKDEEKFDTLWQEYFKNVNIVERKNERQQNNYLPKKYRWFMNEF